MHEIDRPEQSPVTSPLTGLEKALRRHRINQARRILRRTPNGKVNTGDARVVVDTNDDGWIVKMQRSSAQAGEVIDISIALAYDPVYGEVGYGHLSADRQLYSDNCEITASDTYSSSSRQNSMRAGEIIKELRIASGIITQASAENPN